MNALNNNMIEEIYKKRCHTFFNYFTTIKFLYSARISDVGIKTIIKKTSDNFSFIKNLLWFFGRYFIVAHEIIKIRKRIFNMMCNSYATEFSDYEFYSILNNSSNWWLDSSYEKIHLLTDYCDDLFNDPLVCEYVCNASLCSSVYYHDTRKRIISIMREIEDESCSKFVKKTNLEMEERQKSIKKPMYMQAEMSAEMYKRSFEESSLLNYEVNNNV